MDESANKGMKLRRCDAVPSGTSDKKKRRCDAAIPKARDIERIRVRGFDIGLPRKEVESALGKHFASCGKITDLCIHPNGTVGYIYFVGEGAADKAVKLSGSDLGGWKVCAQAFPFHDDDSPTIVTVGGFSESLSDSEIKTALTEHFSSCGEVEEVSIMKNGIYVVYLIGIEAPAKALQLDGSTIIGCKVVVQLATIPPRYTKHLRRVYR